MKKRLLILCVYPEDRVPGQRFRFEQYLGSLRENDFEITFASLFNARDYKVFMSQGRFFAKTWITLRGFFKRLLLCRKIKSYDVALIYREAFIAGPPWIEMFITKRIPCIYDFDDAIWLRDMSEHNRAFGFLKNTGKISKIMSACRCVVAGNNYLADYARQFNPDVHVIPSTIDMNKYRCEPFGQKDRVCIGWSGSGSTIRFFRLMIPVLERIKQHYGDLVKFKVIADKAYYFPELDNEACCWTSAKEVEDLCDLDIGIMPLTDDAWSRGKCGMKGLQYMALGIATVMSPVGVNTQIITEGNNGLLASDDNAWFEKLSVLVEDHVLRKKLGEAGRHTVSELYSTRVFAPVWTRLFTEAAGMARARVQSSDVAES